MSHEKLASFIGLPEETFAGTDSGKRKGKKGRKRAPPDPVEQFLGRAAKSRLPDGRLASGLTLRELEESILKPSFASVKRRERLRELELEMKRSRREFGRSPPVNDSASNGEGTRRDSNNALTSLPELNHRRSSTPGIASVKKTSNEQQKFTERSLTKAEMGQLKNLYESSGFSVTSWRDLGRFVSKIGEHLTEADLIEEAQGSQWEGSGVISLPSLLFIMAKVKERHKRTVVDDITAAFRALASDGDAFAADKFRAMVNAFQLTVDAERMIREADEDGSGLIEFDEFETMIEGIQGSEASDSGEEIADDRKHEEMQQRYLEQSPKSALAVPEANTSPAELRAFSASPKEEESEIAWFENSWFQEKKRSNRVREVGKLPRSATAEVAKTRSISAKGEPNFVTVKNPRTGKQTKLRLPPLNGATHLTSLYDRKQPAWKVSFQSHIFK